MSAVPPEQNAEPAQYRAHFDARVEFANGGGLSAEAFRLDVPGPDVDEAEVARLLVQHLGLALVGSVTLTGLKIVEEQHRGSRGIEAAPAASGRRVVDLSHHIREGMVTYPGLPAPVFTPHLTREASREKYAPGTEFALDLISMIGNTGTYLDSPFHRYGDGADLAGLDLATLVDWFAGGAHPVVNRSEMADASDSMVAASTSSVACSVSVPTHVANASSAAWVPYSSARSLVSCS